MLRGSLQNGSLQEGEEAAKKGIHLKWKRLTYDSKDGQVNGSLTLVGNSVYHAGFRGTLAVLSCENWQWQLFGKRLLGLGNYHCAQLAADKIYYIGGNMAKGVVEYDTVLHNVNRIAEKSTGESPAGRKWMSSVFAPWRNEIVTFGGFFDGDVARSNETHAFNVDMKSWRKLELRGRLPEPRTGHSATMCSSKMYVYGGYDRNAQLLGDICIAELGAHYAFWSLPQVNGRIPVSRTVAALNNLNGLLVMFGGHAQREVAKGELNIFSPETNMWLSSGVKVQGSSPRTKTRRCGLKTSNGVLYFTRDGIYLLSQA